MDFNNGFGNDNEYVNGQNLGVAGELKYSGDAFSGEISGVYRSINSSDYNLVDANGDTLYNADIDNLWQIGAGIGFNLGDIASLSMAAAMGSGPYQEVNSSGNIYDSYPVNNDWWGVSGLATANLSDAVHAEAGLGYKHREGDGGTREDLQDGELWKYSGFEYDTWAILGGVYYTPVDQLTIGVEGEWYTQSWEASRKGADTGNADQKDELEVNNDNWSVDLVSVWRF